jgi:hypothetical protein
MISTIVILIGSEINRFEPEAESIQFVYTGKIDNCVADSFLAGQFPGIRIRKLRVAKKIS